MKYALLILTLMVGFASAQNNSPIIVNGKVTDQNGEPLPYANVSFADNRRGTVCNNGGEFKILIPSKYQDDFLSFSFIGFESVKVKIKDITGHMHVRLKECALSLKEAVVTSYSGDFLVKEAIEKIPDNYLSNPYISKGFYRVSTNKSEEYVHLSEAVFDIYHGTEASFKKPFKLDKMRAIKDESEAHGVTIGQSPRTILAQDIINGIENSELLNKKGLKNHEFILEGITRYDGLEVYKISFKKKADSKKIGYNGFMLIEKETLAFLYFEKSIDEEDLEEVKFGNAAMRLLMKMMDINMNLLKDTEIITYKKIDNQYFLNRVYSNDIMSMRSDRENYDFNLNHELNYVVTEIDLEDPKPFPNNETMALGKQIESLNSSYDSTFWEDYTIILPEQDFGTIARSIDQKNQSHNHKEEIEHRINRYAKQKDIRVDSILSFYNRKGLFNGNALVTYEGELIFEKSYNNDLTKNHENSQFRIGSTSKTFTAMLVMLLEAQSKLQLSDPVSKFLPDYKHGKATIKQLLTHQSGIPDYLNDGFHLDELYAKAYTTDELISRFCSDTLEFAHGQQFDYSNSGYVLLAGIIEKVTDKPFGQVLQEMIFEPLGMTDSYFGTSANNKNLSKGYLFNQPEPNFPVLNTIGAGGITTTTQDLLKWSRALDNASLVSNDLIKELWEPRAAYLDWDAYYGYGWMIDQAQFGVTKKHQIVYHPGTDNGFNSMFLKQPDKGITIILLNNTGAFPRFDITDLILAELDR